MSGVNDDIIEAPAIRVDYFISDSKIIGETVDITVEDGRIIAFDPKSLKSNVKFEFKLSSSSKAILRGSSVKVTNGKFHVTLYAQEISFAQEWKEFINREIILCKFSTSEGSGDPTRRAFYHSSRAAVDESDDEEEDSLPLEPTLVPSQILPPKMTIVILVVGTRGDVQPFIYFGQALKRDGHRVRVATHVDYRDDVIKKGGLEYYPLAGDPKKLSEYMVKTAGRLMPDILSKEEMRELPEKMAMIRDITYSCYPACTSHDPEDPLQRPFLADAIISNPVSYGHIHCAEALSVPLHIMFPQPWSPTKEFPHPLSNMGFTSKWSSRNKLSYKLMDEFMWIGLGGMMNRFRQEVLKLSPVRAGERGDQLLNDNKVPISHMWSPTFVPKCKDWPRHVDVVGEYRLTNAQVSTFAPPQPLVDFLAGGERPLYVGFGSMVIEDGARLVNLVKAAADKLGCRVLMQSGWTKYGEDNELLSDKVMVIGAMPHDWLFNNVAGVVHHGGAGTTSAGLRGGNPTFICPFFGDQHFWAEMVYRSGAGPKGCRIQDLTVEKLVESFSVMRSPEVIAKAKELGDHMNEEDGVSNGVQSFYNNLPLAHMICEVCVFDNKTSKLAQIFCETCNLKMSLDADHVVHRPRSGRGMHVRHPFRPCHLGVVNPQGIMSGISQGMSSAAYEVAGGIYDLVAKGSISSFFARPMKGGKILMNKVKTGATQSSHASEIEKPTGRSPTHASVTVSSFVPDDLDSLSPDDRKLEEAYQKALKLLTVWNKIDKDGNRCIDVKELRDYADSEEVARRFFDAVDTNSDQILTFTEVAWVVANEENFENIFHLLPSKK